MVSPLFCKHIKKNKEKYMLGINIPIKMSKFKDFFANLHGCHGNIVTMVTIYSHFKTFIMCAFGLDNCFERCLLMFKWVVTGK